MRTIVAKWLLGIEELVNMGELHGNGIVFDIYSRLNSVLTEKPRVGIVMGSGLESNLKDFQTQIEIELKDVEGYPKLTVKEHSGKLLFGELAGVPTMIFMGRLHYYEGYSMDEVIVPMRLAGLLGVEVMILTNSAGAINCEFGVGDFVLIEDHISLFVPNCLRGTNDDRFGTRFPDMTEVYDKELIGKAEEIARQGNIKTHRGVYVQLSGPSFETAAEIRMLRTLGADVVGMSTVCEAICCRHMGVKVCAISCVSNMATGINNQKQSYLDVKNTAESVSDKFAFLINGLVRSLK